MDDRHKYFFKVMMGDFRSRMVSHSHGLLCAPQLLSVGVREADFRTFYCGSFVSSRHNQLQLRLNFSKAQNHFNPCYNTLAMQNLSFLFLCIVVVLNDS